MSTAIAGIQAVKHGRGSKTGSVGPEPGEDAARKSASAARISVAGSHALHSLKPLDEEDLEDRDFSKIDPRNLGLYWSSHMETAAYVEQDPTRSQKALCVLAHDNPFRMFCRSIFCDSRFAMTVLVLILANAALMFITYAWPGCWPHSCVENKAEVAADGISLSQTAHHHAPANYEATEGLHEHDPNPAYLISEYAKTATAADDIFSALDMFFTIAFLLEMLLKICALGFIMHRGSYLRSGWNILDFVTVCASLVSLSGLGGNVSVLRLFRVLRPLRTMSRIAGLRKLMGALFGAAPVLRDNVILIIFLVLIFAILGVQLFEGRLRRRCVLYENTYEDGQMIGVYGRYLPTLGGDDGDQKHCGSCDSCLGLVNCHDPQYLCHGDVHGCDNASGLDMRLFPDNYYNASMVRCESDEHVRDGLDDLSVDPLDYDNVGRASLLIFKVFTGDDWPEDMNELQNSVGNGSFVYFFLCIFVGNLFATNLFLAVLINAYYANSTGAEEEDKRKKQIALKILFSRRDSALGIERPRSRGNSLLRGPVSEHMSQRKVPQSPPAKSPSKRYSLEKDRNKQPGDGKQVIDSPGGPPTAVPLAPPPDDPPVDRPKRPAGGDAEVGELSPERPASVKMDSVGSHAEDEHARATATTVRGAASDTPAVPLPAPPPPLGGGQEVGGDGDPLFTASAQPPGGEEAFGAAAGGAGAATGAEGADGAPRKGSATQPPLPHTVADGEAPPADSAQEGALAPNGQTTTDRPASRASGAKVTSPRTALVVDSSQSRGTQGSRKGSRKVSRRQSVNAHNIPVEEDEDGNMIGRFEALAEQQGARFGLMRACGSIRSEAKPPPMPLPGMLEEEDSVKPAGLTLVRQKVAGVVMSKQMQNFILGVTVFNVIVLAMDNFDETRPSATVCRWDPAGDPNGRCISVDGVNESGGPLLCPYNLGHPSLDSWRVKPVIDTSLDEMTCLIPRKGRLPKDGVDPNFYIFQNVANLACTIIFAVEISAKTFGLGFTKTYLDKENGASYNIFDLVLVLASLPDLVSGSGGAITAFRALRLVKMVRRWPSVNTLLKALIGCLGEGVYASMLILLMIFIFSILGILFFERGIPPFDQSNPDYERRNFNTLYQAALTCFVIITGDAWGACMKTGMVNKGAYMSLYFLFLSVVGNWVLINVFVAVILDKLDTANNEAEGADVIITISGTNGKSDCDGEYHRSNDDDDHEVLWKRREEDGKGKENVRYLFSSEGVCVEEQKCWVVWHNTERTGAQGLLVSSERGEDNRMPQQVDSWRHGFTDPAWDDDVKIDAMDADDEDDLPRPKDNTKEKLAAAAAAKLADDLKDQGQVERTVKVAKDWTEFQKNVGVSLQGQTVLDVTDSELAQKGVHPNWILAAVDGTTTNTQGNIVNALKKTQKEQVTVLFVKPVETCPDEDDMRLVWQEPDACLQEVGLAARCCASSDPELIGVSFLPPDNKIRLFLSRIVHSMAFDMLIMLLIFANVVFLCIDWPQGREDYPKLKEALTSADWFFTMVFLAEMLLKFTVLGFWHHRGEDRDRDQSHAYFRDPYNCVDCFVVITALVGLEYESFAVFRSLRTLRLVIRSQQLKIIITALVGTLPAVSKGIVVVMFIFFVFAIFGISLFKGQFWMCSFDGEGRAPRFHYDVRVDDSNGTTRFKRMPEDGIVIDSITDCDIYGGTWMRSTNAADHFDNIGNALLNLLAISIGEGWSDQLYMGMDVRGIDLQPDNMANPGFGVYFLIVHIAGNWFCLNLLIGILISEFTEARQKLDQSQGSSRLSSKAKSYISAEKAVLYSKMFQTIALVPEKDFCRVRRRCFEAQAHPNFDRLITTAILVNMVSFATRHYNQKKGFDDFQNWANFICSVVFIGEMIVKLMGLGGHHYFRSSWNKFDFAIVMVSILDMFEIPGLPLSGLSAIRVLRVGRLFRLIGKAKGLQKLFNTMFQGDNLSYFSYVGLFCIAVIFMFAVAGVNLFGTIEDPETGRRPRAGGIDHNINFDNVGNGMITLITIATTEAWLDVRDGLMDGVNRKGEPTVEAGHIFGVVYIIMSGLILLNLFAAVVVELFDRQETLERCMKEIDAIEEFRNRWRERFGPVHVVKEVPVQDFLDALQDDTPEVPEGIDAPPGYRRGLLPGPQPPGMKGAPARADLRRLPRKGMYPDDDDPGRRGSDRGGPSQWIRLPTGPEVPCRLSTYKIIDNVAGKYEGRDDKGVWWPIIVIDRDPWDNKYFTAKINPDTGFDVVWKRLHLANVRPVGGYPKPRRKGKEEELTPRSPDTPQAAPGQKPGGPAALPPPGKKQLKKYQRVLLAYLTALGLPIHARERPKDGSPQREREKKVGQYENAVVRYREAVFCFAARAFLLSPEEMEEIHEEGLSLGPRINRRAFCIDHWLAVQMLATNMRERIAERKRRQKVREQAARSTPGLTSACSPSEPPATSAAS